MDTDCEKQKQKANIKLNETVQIKKKVKFDWCWWNENSLLGIRNENVMLKNEQKKREIDYLGNNWKKSGHREKKVDANDEPNKLIEIDDWQSN